MADDSSETPVAPPQPVLHTDNVASFLDLQASENNTKHPYF